MAFARLILAGHTMEQQAHPSQALTERDTESETAPFLIALTIPIGSILQGQAVKHLPQFMQSISS